MHNGMTPCNYAVPGKLKDLGNPTGYAQVKL